IYLILHPEEGDLKTLKYRKDIPQHRLYFHEYAQPDKIAYKVRQIVDWINDPESKRGRNALRIASRSHYDLLRLFPFALDCRQGARDDAPGALAVQSPRLSTWGNVIPRGGEGEGGPGEVEIHHRGEVVETLLGPLFGGVDQIGVFFRADVDALLDGDDPLAGG